MAYVPSSSEKDGVVLKVDNLMDEEKLGFTGRKEGISAHSVCLIEK